MIGSTILVTVAGDAGVPGDIRYAIASANPGDTIDIAYTGTITLTQGALAINENLTILGSGGAINGNGGIIFNVNGSTTSDVSFSKLTLLNASDAITGSAGPTITLFDSTIENSVNYGLLGVAGTVTNSTFSGNAVAISNSTLGLYDSTIVGGSGDTGIQLTTLTIANSIVAGNTTDMANNTINGANCNLIENGTGSGITNGTNGNQVGAGALNPELGSLANNGGLTQTIALLGGSPAIGAGCIAQIPSGVTTDQRGFNRVSGGTVDVGAFETQQVQSTPEPATYLTCVLGIAMGALWLRKRNVA